VQNKFRDRFFLTRGTRIAGQVSAELRQLIAIDLCQDSCCRLFVDGHLHFLRRALK
jgi:hypothetical protein